MSTAHAAYWVLGVSRSTGTGDPALVAETWYCARSRNKQFLMNMNSRTSLPGGGRQRERRERGGRGRKGEDRRGRGEGGGGRRKEDRIGEREREERRGGRVERGRERKELHSKYKQLKTHPQGNASIVEG